jgi:hypothetical protein
MSSNYASTVSGLLQANWSLAAPLAVANLLWPTTRMDALGATQGKGSLQVAVYNASPSKQVDHLSQKCYLVTEKLIVDIIVVNASQSSADLAASEATLDSLQAEVYRIIHLQDPNYEISGEPLHGNAPDITRLMINVNAVYFHISS